MKTFHKYLIVFAWIIGTFLPTMFVFAAGTCACTSSDKNCLPAALNPGQQSQAACDTVCKTKLGTSYTSSDYGDGTAGEAVAFKCNASHQTFTAGSAAASGSTTTPPAAASALITPVLNVDIPELTFSKGISGPCTYDANQTCVKTNYLAEYLNGIYAFLITTLTTIAIVMIMIGGLQYTLGAASEEQVKKGKEKIKNSVTGLVLLLCVFLILQTVNPQLTFLKMVELQNIEGQEIEDAPSDAGAQTAPGYDPKVKTGAPSQKGDGAVMTRLLGSFPSQFKKCSKEAANFTADALSKKNVCVGPNHCAYTSSNFLEYIGCTNIYSGNAHGLAAELDASGWSSMTIRTAKQFETLPFGLLIMNGHVGISLGDGYQFDSGGQTLDFIKNPSGGARCPSNPTALNTSPTSCDYCSFIPEEAPRTKRFSPSIASPGKNQGWFKIKAAKTWRGDPSRDTWQIIVVPPQFASQIQPSQKKPCTVTAGSKPHNMVISENLCTLINLSKAQWKALPNKP